MAGAGLLEIKRRIKSIKNTRKITKAYCGFCKR